MIYFDNAATTYPKPYSVVEEVHSAITYYGGNPGRGGHDISMRVSEKIYSVRKMIAEFFHAQTQNVVFTSNCTSALNIAIKGTLKQGDHVIISCLEHNSVFRPIYKLASEGKITYDIAKVYVDTERTIASFKTLIQPNTKAIVCTHASNVTGEILPIASLGKLCQEKGILLIIDAAQTAGILPIDIQALNIDILCTAGHKGLYGITGTGLLVLNREMKLETLFEGGSGSISISPEQPDFYPDRMEAGTLNTVGILSLGAGISFINRIGINNIYEHEFQLCNYLYREFSSINNVILYTQNFLKNKYAPVVSFNIKNIPSDKTIALCNQAQFALRGGLHCAPLTHEHYKTTDLGMVRFSPSYFSKKTNVDKFVKFIRYINKNQP